MKGSIKIALFLSAISALLAVIVMVSSRRAGNVQPIHDSRKHVEHEKDEKVDLSKSDLAKLGEEADKQAEALRVKSHLPQTQWQKERIANIAAETLPQVIQNIANLDDNHFAMTSGGEGFNEGDPEDEMRRIINLSRCRRLLEAGRSDPSVLPLLRNTLEKELPRWPEVREARVKKWIDNPNGFIEDGPDEYKKNYIRITVATYLIAELQDFESILLISKSCHMQLEWARTFKPYPVMATPVPPAIFLYALHRLVTNYPIEKLSKPSTVVRDSYVKWAATNLSPPRDIVVSAWDAPYDTSDPMTLIADPNGSLLRAQRQIELKVYPVSYKDGVLVQKVTTQDVQERGATWYELLDAFARTIYGSP